MPVTALPTNEAVSVPEATRPLDWLNFFLADVRDGLGPYLAVYLLAVEHWDAAKIGMVISIGGVAALLAQTPAGAMVDRSMRKRGVIIAAAILVTLGSLLLPLLPSFWFVAAAQAVTGAAGSVFAPAIAAVTLGIVGPRAFARRVGRNESFNHAGNATAATLAGTSAYFFGPIVVFWLMAGMAVASILAALRIPADAIDNAVARGLKAGEETSPDHEQPSGFKVLLECRPLLVFAACCALFHFANAAMLPLVGQKLAQTAHGLATTLMAICIVAAQLVMVPMAMLVGAKADLWGRKPLFLAGFAILPLRGLLYTFSDNPYWLLGVQALDGVGAGLFGALFPLVVADLTRGTGRFNVSQGAITTAQGIGAALSTTVAGLIVVEAGYSAAFLFLAGVALAALGLFWFLMPETSVRALTPQNDVLAPGSSLLAPAPAPTASWAGMASRTILVREVVAATNTDAAIQPRNRNAPRAWHWLLLACLILAGLAASTQLWDWRGAAAVWSPSDLLGKVTNHLPQLVAVAIFAATYLVIAIGKLPGFHLDRAGAALLGASLMVVADKLSMADALAAVDLNTIVLLLGMMIVVANLHLSGLFRLVSNRVAAQARHPLILLAAVTATSGLFSAFMVNDTICLVLTPLVLDLVIRFRRNPVPYLLAAAMASNVGSTATITGNPQNMLIGSFSQIPYGSFFAALAPVAAIGLVLTTALIAAFYPSEFWTRDRLQATPEPARAHQGLAIKASLVSVGMLVAFFLGQPPAKVAIVAGALLLFTRTVKPEKVYREIDWPLLVMFAGLFVTVAGFEKAVLSPDVVAAVGRLQLDQVPMLSLVTATLSNLVSNVPAVLVLKPFIASLHDPQRAWLTVAMASTLAGNLTVLGSVANLIVVQRARRRGIEIGFWTYVKVGAPLTLLTIILGIVWVLYGPGAAPGGP
jgi:Na+/H+ antiporter NhaD/arsenite permease-like protein/predicted MFS family arabinose efflux permease